MGKKKLFILFSSGMVFFFLGVVSFLQFSPHHKEAQVKGVHTQREVSQQVTPTSKQVLSPTVSPTPLVTISVTSTLPSPIVKPTIQTRTETAVPPKATTIQGDWKPAIADNVTLTDEEEVEATSSGETTSSGHGGSTSRVWGSGE